MFCFLKKTCFLKPCFVSVGLRRTRVECIAQRRHDNKSLFRGSICNLCCHISRDGGPPEPMCSIRTWIPIFETFIPDASRGQVLMRWLKTWTGSSAPCSSCFVTRWMHRLHHACGSFHRFSCRYLLFFSCIPHHQTNRFLLLSCQRGVDSSWCSSSTARSMELIEFGAQ